MLTCVLVSGQLMISSKPGGSVSGGESLNVTLGLHAAKLHVYILHHLDGMRMYCGRDVDKKCGVVCRNPACMGNTAMSPTCD